ncbi:MAG: LCP family protein [Clostridia bacterium]|nr:LCP family protein [Clostridia bacterium]
MRGVRDFFLSFILSMLVLGGVTLWVIKNPPSFGVKKPTLPDSTVSLETDDKTNFIQETLTDDPAGADANDEPVEIVIPQGNVSDATFLFVGTDYQPSVLDYNKSGYDENGLYVQERKVSADSLILMKINRRTKTFLFSVIPANAIVNKSTNKTISQLYSEKGPNYMVDCVYALTGIQVEHLAVISVEDCVKAMKKVGNITYNVPCDMYYSDPVQKLEINLKRGVQELTPKQAVSMLRFRDYPKGSGYDRDRMLLEFSQSLMYKLTSPAYIETAVSLFESALTYFQTNFTVDDFKDHMDLIFSFPSYKIQVVTYPGYTKDLYGENVFVPTIGEAMSAYEEFK